MSFLKEVRLDPVLRGYLEGISSGMSGDILLEVKADEADFPATSSAWTRVVSFKLVDSDGRTMTWFNGTGSASVVDTSVAGTASLDTATPAFVGGIGQVIVSGDAQDWLATETVTVTIDVGAILGVDPASVDHVITVV